MPDPAATVQFPVEASQIMLFARAIGYAEPPFDAPGGGAMMAPPTFTETLQQFIPGYHARPDPRKPWIGSGRDPTGLPAAPSGETTLHAEQHFEYHRPIQAGDKLVATTRAGRAWEKDGRSGRMHFFERVTEFRDASGNPVVTSTLVGVTIRPGKPETSNG
ncbi:FAS1-like dehydratase domain-containing protein [Sphingomonas oryzagri]